MKSLSVKKCGLCIFTLLVAISWLIFGSGYACAEEVEVKLISHRTHHVYKPGDTVEITGTAQGVKEVVIAVESEQDELVFTDRPPVEDGAFKTSLTLSPEANEGKYTIILGVVRQPEMKRYKFSVAPDGVYVPEKGEVAENAVLTVNGDGVEKEVSFTRAELKAMNQERKIYSVVNDWPAKLFVAAEGVPLQTLLEQAGIKPEAQMVTVRGSDGYRIDFTTDELLRDTRYYFPELMSSSTAGRGPIEPIIALQRVEQDDDFSQMNEQDTPVLCFGQRAVTEQTLCEFVKRLKTITVTMDSPGQWDKPVASVVDPDTGQKAVMSGGSIKPGSKIILESDPKVKIYYTTDGSAPDLNSRMYNVSFHVPTLNEPILVEKDITIKAKTVGFGKHDSEVVAFRFTVDSSLELNSQDGYTFSDIQSSWAQEDIELLAARGLLRGKSQTNYEPGSNITRAEFAALLVRALGLEEVVSKESQFKDVPDTAWYAGSAAAASGANIITGYDNLFKPNDNITREEMAVMIARAVRTAGYEEALSHGEQEEQLAQFSDRQLISPWAEKEVALTVRAGIIQGMPGGKIEPHTNADRAQSAIILKRFLSHVNLLTD